MQVSTRVLHSLSYYKLRVSPEIRVCKFYSLVCTYMHCTCVHAHLCVICMYVFTVWLSLSIKRKVREISVCDPTELVGSWGVNWHLNKMEFSNPWAWYSSPHRISFSTFEVFSNFYMCFVFVPEYVITEVFYLTYHCSSPGYRNSIAFWIWTLFLQPHY